MGAASGSGQITNYFNICHYHATMSRSTPPGSHSVSAEDAENRLSGDLSFRVLGL